MTQTAHSLTGATADRVEFRSAPLPGQHRQAARRYRYSAAMDMLYMATSGSSDPTRASIPLHLAVNGSVEAGQTAGLILAGDASELLKRAVRDAIEGVGLPPMRELVEKARQHELPIYV